MPYIKSQDRTELDDLIDKLVITLQRDQGEHGPSAGKLNYVITKLLDKSHPQHSYEVYNKISGILSCVDKEFYRRRTAPYEDYKIFENGDVFSTYTKLPKK